MGQLGRAAWGLTIVAALALSGCDRQAKAPAEKETPVAKDSEGKKSIFRPEFQVEPIGGEEAPPPLDSRIEFPEGADLTETAKAELATILESPQLAEGGAIILRGHSDSGGDDEANMRVSKERAEAVRDWLVENGVADDRITVIAFGEQNPVAPNALPDGSANEKGRAANRRVDIHVDTVIKPEPTKEPTLAETLSEPSPAESEPER